MPASYENGYRWILTVIDHCTSWPIAVPLKEATAAELAQAIFDHVVTPFGVPKEFLTDRGSNFLSSGFLQFLKTAGVKKLNTAGYHPQTNGKCERYNGILEAAIFRLNTTGDPSRWEDVLPAALFSTRIHTSDSSGFSPFELLYGVRPRLPKDKRKLIAHEAVLPGQQDLAERIRQLNETRILSADNTAKRAEANREAFDLKAKFSRDLASLEVGQTVKLRNEKHTKGAVRWFGPFEIAKVLPNNVYILVDHDGIEYPRPVNGNSIRPVSLRSLIVNDMWAAPPAIAQREKRKEAKVAKALIQKTKKLSKVKTIPAAAPTRRLKLRLGPPPAFRLGLGQPQVRGGDGCSRATCGPRPKHGLMHR
jgi:hypothetical protein